MKMRADVATFLTIALLGVLTWSWFDGPAAQIVDAELAHEARLSAQVDRMKEGGRALVNLSPPAPGDTVPPFPGAVGHGAQRWWSGEGGSCSKDSTVVFHIRSLSAYSAGGIAAILQDSLELYPDSVLKIIVADTSGLSSATVGLGTGKAICTIWANQTAQGDGIWYSAGNYNAGYGGISLSPNDTTNLHSVVISHLRVTNPKDTIPDEDGDALQIDHGARVIVANSELYGGNDGGFDFKVRTGTSMFNLIAHSVDPHATTGLCGSIFDWGRTVASYFGNVGVGAGHRTPCAVQNGAMVEMVNNASYDPATGRFFWARPGANLNDSLSMNSLDMIGNLLEEGPGNDGPTVQVRIQNAAPVGGGQSKAEYLAADTMFFADNVFVEWTAQAADTQHTSWLEWVDEDGPEDDGMFTQSDLNTLNTTGRHARHTGLTFPVVPITLPGTPAGDSAAIIDLVTDSAGSGWKVNCNGVRVDRSNAVRDRALRWIEDGKTGAGNTQIDSLVQIDSTGISYGRPSSLTAAPRCPDTDGDGLFDGFENAYWGDLSSFRDEDPDGDGFINIIEMLWGTNPTLFTNPDGTETEALPGERAAFPEAVGWGASALTTCNKDSIYVHKITSTAASGTGTLDSAWNHLHDDTLDLIIFQTGGWIDGLSDISGAANGDNCVYVAGQTAPGGGIGIYTRWRWMRVGGDAHDIVLRGITFSGKPRDSDTSTPQLQWEDVTYSMLAEMDFYFSTEKAVSIATTGNGDTIHHVTAQRLLLALPNMLEPTLATGADDCRTNSGCTDGTTRIDHVSWYKSLFQSGSHRNPSTGQNEGKPDPLVKLAGTFIYNPQQGVGYTSASYVDVVDTYVKPGPMTDSRYDWAFTYFLSSATPAAQDSDASIYIERLIGAHNRDTLTSTDSLWYPASTAEMACYYRDCIDPGGGGDPRDSIGTQIKRDTAVTPAALPMPRVNPYDLQDELAGTASDSGQVGNYRGVDSTGTWFMRSDSMHAQMLKQVRDSTGISISTTVDSTWIAARDLWDKPAGTAPTDTDGDGMPDAFESAYFASATAAVKTDDPDSDGWTNIEEYVNGTDPTAFTNTESAPSEPPATGYTYSGSRFVYLFPVAGFNNEADTLLISDGDTFNISGQTATFDSVPHGTQARQWVTAGHDSAIVLTCDELSTAEQDSAAIDALFAAWGFTGAYPWTFTPSGCP